MIDFTNCTIRNKGYGGANGGKLCVMYNARPYMLKFPPYPSKNELISYTNSCISEYLGSKIFKSAGIPVQEVELGIYRLNGKEKTVVACKDFTYPCYELQEFYKVKNAALPHSESELQTNGYGTELDDVLTAIRSQSIYKDKAGLEQYFWDMFIVDALLGNWDRHNGNWGLLYNPVTDQQTIAPVFDCGSCLYPQADEQIMQALLINPGERNTRIYNIPTSALKQNGKKLKYFDFISSLGYPGCNEALKRIAPRIDLAVISEIIADTPFISDLQRRFYSTMLAERKRRILDYSLEKLLASEKAQPSAQRKLSKMSLAELRAAGQARMLAENATRGQAPEVNPNRDKNRD